MFIRIWRVNFLPKVILISLFPLSLKEVYSQLWERNRLREKEIAVFELLFTIIFDLLQTG